MWVGSEEGVGSEERVGSEEGFTPEVTPITHKLN